MINVQVDIRPARSFLDRVQQKDLPRVVGRTIDRTRNSGRSFLSKSLRKRLAVSKSVVDSSIHTRRSSEISHIAHISRAWFELVMSGDPIPLRDFRARMTRRGVTFQISKRAGRKTYQAKGQPGFIIDRFGGHVFVRKGPDPVGPAKAGIRKVHGPALKHFLLTRRERNALIEHCRQFFITELQRNARFAIQKRGV